MGALEGGGPVGGLDGVGRQTPGSVPPVKGGGRGFGTRPSLARKARIPAAAASPTATPGIILRQALGGQVVTVRGVERVDLAR